MQTQEEFERDALTRLFDSEGWKIYEARIDELAVCRLSNCEQSIRKPIKDLAEINFQAGVHQGIEEIRLLIQELKENVVEGKEPVAEGQ